MENILLEDRNLLGVFAVAMFRGEGDDPIDTGELLLGLATAGAAREILETAELTRTVVSALHHRCRTEWSGDDRGGPVEAIIAEKGAPVAFTVAAADALRHATGPRDVLRALLDDPESRAMEMLRRGRAPVEALRDSLDHDRPLRIADPVPRELHRIRDMLIGRTRYPRVRFWHNPLLAILAPARTNLAPHPLTWLGLEAREQARERGRRKPGTDDALLAVTAMYEVARHYPHLWGDAGEAYNGAIALAGSGVTYAALRDAAARTELGDDPAPMRKIVSEHPGDTATLLRLILADGTRAHRLHAAVTRPDAALP
ncbi:hypothetical protein [Catenuloplanes japonicus]|uniref:hypothetical protein n=1 Tax=Catenuloplanes japonicus TaxID=33876 RepID=UPI000525E73D|nr:hypothetical protein [Catenuloplanes japonicus]